MMTENENKSVMVDDVAVAPNSEPWHTRTCEEVLRATAELTDLGGEADRHREAGLSEKEAARRLSRYGPNELIDRGMKNPWLILWEQLTGIMVVILIAAAVISLALGHAKDSIVILLIVVLNALLGFTQEYRAEKAILALKKLAVPRVKVRRDGQVQEISGRELVPGDIVLLEAGNLVPADCRVLEAAALRVEEAALTGESHPVEKDPERLTVANLPLGDRRNMAYKGTTVTYGRGVVVVTETGMRTELGRIADMIQTVHREPTPLQRRLGQLGRGLAVAALVLVGIVFALGLWRGESLSLMFLTSMSMAVAAVPEGLPAVVTIALALGAQRMLKRRSLIRKLPAVETLGSVTVICSDKTGTLTENRMTVTVLDFAGDRIELEEHLRRMGGVVEAQPLDVTEPPGYSADSDHHGAMNLLLAGGTLCNDAQLVSKEKLEAIGDPTEAALVVAAARFGLRKPDLERCLPRVGEIPFDSERKRMTTLHRLPATEGDFRAEFAALGEGQQADARSVAFTKGAVDELLKVCRAGWTEAGPVPLSDQGRERILAAQNDLAAKGMRVLGIAARVGGEWPASPDPAMVERELTFLGMVGMIDPPRQEVKAAVETCRTAGIRPVMITGDHPLTARRIAEELGICSGGRTVTGPELERMSVEDLEQVVEEVHVYARVSPEHKLKIVQALQKRGHIAAMTGDGVNDAPALKKADIGVAMGITGTDVSKEAADMVLLDDNFATIVSAVKEGRVIYDNIRKFIKYTMTSNAGEIWVMLLAPFAGMPLPLLPLQILWINLVTDGLPGLALGVEPAERGIMRRAPFHPQENIFGRGMGKHILWVGFLMGLAPLLVGFWYWKPDAQDDRTWQTMVFTTLTLAQMGHALAIRSGRDSLFTAGLLSNKPLLAAVLLTFGMQMAVTYMPFLQGVFRTVALSPVDLAIALALSTVVFWAVELEKWVLRRSGA